MATVSLNQLRKRYHKTEVIHGVDLNVADGEFIVIVGPSGCGKSTLLRMVAGLETITSGEVRIGNKVVNDLEPRERDVAMVFQNYALYPHMNVFNNMAYGLKIAKLPKAEIEQRVQSAADTLELSELLARKPAALSGGQRQRVAMGRAIVRNPQVFLFDEPLSNLDAKLRVQMRLEIKQLQAKLGTTTLYVTHDQVEAMTLADRLVVMNAGIAEQVDEPMNIFEQPETSFVAGFIGTPPMNLIPGILRQDGVETELEYENGLRLPLPLTTLVPSNHDRAVHIGVRPDMFRLSRAEDADVSRSGSRWRADVALIEPLGGESVIHARLIRAEEPQGRTGQDHAAAESLRAPTISIQTRERLHVGEHVDLHFDRPAMHCFDRGDGKRVDLD